MSRGELKTMAVLAAYFVLLKESSDAKDFVDKAKISYSDEKRCKRRSEKIVNSITELIKNVNEEEKKYVLRKATDLIVTMSKEIDNKTYAPFFLAHQLLLLHKEHLTINKVNTKLLDNFAQDSLYFIGDVEENLQDENIDSYLHFKTANTGLEKTIW